MNAPFEMQQPRPGDKCLICGGPPAFIGIFVPEMSGTYGAPEGKQRFVRYCLCQQCNEKEDKCDRAEKIIQSELTGGIIHAD